MLWYYLCAVNVVGFALMAWDKLKAKLDGWRVQEKHLLGLAAIGGGVGVYLGMRVFHHKTRHALFSLGVPAIIVCQLALYLVLGFIGC